MKRCQNYHCESKGKKLPDEAFAVSKGNRDNLTHNCKDCINKAYTGVNMRSGTLRMRMEKQGIKLSPVDTWSRT